MRVYALDKDFHEVSFNLGVLTQRGFKDFKTAIRYYQDFIGKAGVSDPNHPVYKNIKQCEDEIKAQEMMNAPAPTPTPAVDPGKEGTAPGAPGDVATDKGASTDPKKDGGSDKPKADAGTPANGGKMAHQ